MFKRREKTHTRIDTLIGRNASIQGDIDFSGGLHVDGRVAGSVRAASEHGALSVSEDGVIEGSVAAPHVVLNGRVHGDIYGTERVVLGSKAKVHGNVHYGVIEMALGAQISGKLVPRSSGALPSGGDGRSGGAPPPDHGGPFEADELVSDPDATVHDDPGVAA
ncbi:MAG: bactofilin family protein [Steroidobacteraceae bacterium]